MNFVQKVMQCTSFCHKVRRGSENELLERRPSRQRFMIDATLDLHIDAILAMEFHQFGKVRWVMHFGRCAFEILNFELF